MGAPHPLAIALRHGPDLGGFVAPERIAGVLLLGRSPQTVAALLGSARVKRRLTSLIARRLGLGPGVAPAAVRAFHEAYPGSVPLRAADLLGLAVYLRAQGPLLLKADLTRLAKTHGRDIVEQALSLSLRPSGQPDLDMEEHPDFRRLGVGMLTRWAKAHFGTDAVWIEAGLPDLAPYPLVETPDVMVAQALDWTAAGGGEN